MAGHSHQGHRAAANQEREQSGEIDHRGVTLCLKMGRLKIRRMSIRRDSLQIMTSEAIENSTVPTVR
jgi:hypothetical protein